MCSPRSSWLPLRLFVTEAFDLGNLRTSYAFFYYFGAVRQTAFRLDRINPRPKASRTLKTAHPDFLHLAKNQFFQFSLWSHLFSQIFLRSSPRPISISKLLRYRIYTADLSPGSLPGVLLLSNGILILEVGFTLRCLQRLSRPHFASQLCPWQDNCCTSDAFTPVLSY